MNDRNNRDPSPLDHWTCLICSKPISPTRPPTFNADNCSCVEKASLAGGRGLTYGPFPSVSSPYDQTHAVQQFEPAPLQCTHIPESNASTNINDIPCPEGIEGEKPDLPLLRDSVGGDDENENGNHFLVLSPPPGINEIQARRSFSFHADLPFQLQRFLNSLDYNYTTTAFYPAATAAAVGVEEGDGGAGAGAGTGAVSYALPAGILSQEMSFQSNTRMAQNQSSRKSKKSCAERSAVSGGDLSWYDGLRSTEQLAGAGGWVDRDGDFYEGSGGGGGVDSLYPMDINGLLYENHECCV